MLPISRHSWPSGCGDVRSSAQLHNEGTSNKHFNDAASNNIQLWVRRIADPTGDLRLRGHIGTGPFHLTKAAQNSRAEGFHIFALGGGSEDTRPCPQSDSGRRHAVSGKFAKNTTVLLCRMCLLAEDQTSNVPSHVTTLRRDRQTLTVVKKPCTSLSLSLSPSLPPSLSLSSVPPARCPSLQLNIYPS